MEPAENIFGETFEAVKTDNYDLLLIKGGTLLDMFLPILAPMLRRSRQRMQNGRSVEEMIADINVEEKGVSLWCCHDRKETILGCFVCTAQPTFGGVCMTIEVLASEHGFGWIDETVSAFEEEIKRAYGVRWLSIIGPLGWYRVMKKHGYSEPVFVISKDLSPEADHGNAA